MKQILDYAWLYFRVKTRANGGDMTIYGIVGGLLIAAVYFAYPEPFHNFAAQLIDHTLETAKDSFSGGAKGNPDKKFQVK